MNILVPYRYWPEAPSRFVAPYVLWYGLFTLYCVWLLLSALKQRVWR